MHYSCQERKTEKAFRKQCEIPSCFINQCQWGSDPPGRELQDGSQRWTQVMVRKQKKDPQQAQKAAWVVRSTRSPVIHPGVCLSGGRFQLVQDPERFPQPPSDLLRGFGKYGSIGRCEVYYRCGPLSDRDSPENDGSAVNIRTQRLKAFKAHQNRLFCCLTSCGYPLKVESNTPVKVFF